LVKTPYTRVAAEKVQLSLDLLIVPGEIDVDPWSLHLHCYHAKWVR
jgi:hypothetical protein